MQQLIDKIIERSVAIWDDAINHYITISKLRGNPAFGWPEEYEVGVWHTDCDGGERGVWVNNESLDQALQDLCEGIGRYESTK